MLLNDLIELMMNWSKVRIQLAELEERITQDVLGREKTITAGTVRASYSGGRTTYNYESAIVQQILEDGEPIDKDIEGYILEVIEANSKTETITTTDWKTVCEELNLDKEDPDLVPQDKSAPSVTVKFIEDPAPYVQHPDDFPF